MVSLNSRPKDWPSNEHQLANSVHSSSAGVLSPRYGRPGSTTQGPSPSPSGGAYSALWSPPPAPFPSKDRPITPEAVHAKDPPGPQPGFPSPGNWGRPGSSSHGLSQRAPTPPPPPGFQGGPRPPPGFVRQDSFSGPSKQDNHFLRQDSNNFSRQDSNNFSRQESNSFSRQDSGFFRQEGGGAGLNRQDSSIRRQDSGTGRLPTPPGTGGDGGAEQGKQPWRLQRQPTVAEERAGYTPRCPDGTKGFKYGRGKPLPPIATSAAGGGRSIGEGTKSPGSERSPVRNSPVPWWLEGDLWALREKAQELSKDGSAAVVDLSKFLDAVLSEVEKFRKAGEALALPNGKPSERLGVVAKMDIDKARNEAAVLKDEVAGARAVVYALQAELEGERGARKKAEEQGANAGTLQEVQKQLQEAQKEAGRLKADLGEAQAEVEFLKADIKGSFSREKASQDRLEETRTKLLQVQEELEQARQDLKESAAANNKLAEELKVEKDSERGDSTEALSFLKIQLEGERAENGRLRAELGGLQAGNNHLRSQLDGLQMELHRAHQDHELDVRRLRLELDQERSALSAERDAHALERERLLQQYNESTDLARHLFQTLNVQNPSFGASPGGASPPFGSRPDPRSGGGGGPPIWGPPQSGFSPFGPSPSAPPKNQFSPYGHSPPGHPGLVGQQHGFGGQEGFFGQMSRSEAQQALLRRAPGPSQGAFFGGLGHHGMHGGRSQQAPVGSGTMPIPVSVLLNAGREPPPPPRRVPSMPRGLGEGGDFPEDEVIIFRGKAL